MAHIPRDLTPPRSRDAMHQAAEFSGGTVHNNSLEYYFLEGYEYYT
ncbi:Hypothetical protein GbCGDNIH9_8685 [Granulibacter bethesdensis]|uniref:Uncharacterized protein n=1 Tax=Granulibacter bethesdensis TaxID=364410 RepID=A0AAC9P9F1_9PROT|nr:Hypothetical protein GbCGDNIH9_8685 [Granulibacter bethesdensis]APH63043.1 Hypothetical protein GbCGDNIH8_8685 [Granulibacter bethesdensis]